MKNLVQITFLFLWLSAILVPNIVTIVDSDNLVFVANLNDEEQQELDTKTTGEENILNAVSFEFALMAKMKESRAALLNVGALKEYISEIHLPPPRFMG